MRTTKTAEGHKDTRVPQNGAKSGLFDPKLTDAENDVLFLLAHEKLTPNQAAVRRQVKPRAIYKIRQKLIMKGILNVVNDVVHKEGGLSSVHSVHLIRLHDEQYDMKVLWCDERYRKKVLEGNKRIMIDGQTIMLYRDSIEVYSNKSFYGKDADEADRIATKYWAHFFARLEHSTCTTLVKPEHQNITRVRAEYAETDNELATKLIKEHQKIKVVGEDGKTWLVIDNSFDFRECEAVHPKEAKLDIKNVISNFFNSQRDYFKQTGEAPPTIADMMVVLNTILKSQAETAESLNAVVKILQLQQPKPIEEQQQERADYFG